MKALGRRLLTKRRTPTMKKSMMRTTDMLNLRSSLTVWKMEKKAKAPRQQSLWNLLWIPN